MQLDDAQQVQRVDDEREHRDDKQCTDGNEHANGSNGALGNVRRAHARATLERGDADNIRERTCARASSTRTANPLSLCLLS